MIARDIRTLLDAGAMRRHLGAIPVFADGLARLTSVSLERLWVKPGRHFHVSYRVTLQAEAGTLETLASASLLREEVAVSDVVRRAVGAPTPDRRLGWQPSWTAALSTAALESPRIVVQLFPWDYRLPTLGLALDPSSVASCANLGSVRVCRLAGYWPGMRCSVHYRGAGQEGPLYGKVFPPDTVATVAETQTAIVRAVEHAGVLEVPRVHSSVPELNLLLTEPVEGDRLLDRLSHDEGARVIERVAAALAAFHALAVSRIERHFTPADDLAVVEPWVSLVSAVFPDLAAALDECLSEVRRRMPPGDRSRAALVHRDFYDKQILIAPARVGLLDLDTACLGDGEIDVANFCAHLRLRGLQWHSSAEAWAPLGARFLTAYRTCRPRTDGQRVSWYLAAALLRLACLYAMRPSWHALAPRLIAQSHQALRAEGREV